MSVNKNLKPYPNWVCCDCGRAASEGKQFSMSTYHNGFCNVCEQDAVVTEPRDFFYPNFKGHELYPRMTEAEYYDAVMKTSGR